MYEAVVSLGGFQKVSNFEKWKEVLREISIDEDILMVEYGIKMIYVRFLSKFEQNELGTEVDEHESDLLGSRMRMKNFALMPNIEAPVSIPKNYSALCFYFFKFIFFIFKICMKIVVQSIVKLSNHCLAVYQTKWIFQLMYVLYFLILVRICYV